jgi:hypothetical protein
VERLADSSADGRIAVIASMLVWILVAMVGLLAVFAGLVAGGVIGVHYPRFVENRVLLHPQRVRAVTGNHLVLEDGRDIAIAKLSLSPYVELARVIAGSDNMVDVDPDGDGYDVSASQNLWSWATPRVGAIQIPLIADPVEVNERVWLGHGVIDHKPRPTPANSAR